MSYELGAIETVIDAVYDQLVSHQASGERLESVKNIFIGSRKIDDGGNSTPLIVLNPVNFAMTQKTTAGYAGEWQSRLNLEARIVTTKLTKSGQNSKANNCLYDSAGSGAIALLQNFIYALSFDVGTASASTFKPGLGLKLNKMVAPDYRLEDLENYVELITNVNIEYIFGYSKIAGVSS